MTVEWFAPDSIEHLRNLPVWKAIEQLQEQMSEMLPNKNAIEITERDPNKPLPKDFYKYKFTWEGIDCNKLYAGWAETIGLRHRCERLARVIRAFTAQGYTVCDSELAKALSALLPGDLDPSRPD